MTSFTTMAGESEAALVNPIVIFTVLIICGTLFIVSWLSKRSKNVEVKESNKPKARGKNFHTTNRNEFSSHATKKKVLGGGAQKGNPVSQNRFVHNHMLATLKGHTAPITGGDFSSNGKHYITAAQVLRPCHYVPGTAEEEEKESPQYQATNQIAETKCWLTRDDISLSNTPSDTEDSLASSGSSGSKMSRRQKKNKKRKKGKDTTYSSNSSNSGSSCCNENEEPNIPALQTTKFRPRINFTRMGLSEETLHKTLLPLCVSVQERILSGFPYQTNQGTFIYKAQGYSRLEAVLADQRLVEAETKDLNSKLPDMLEDEDLSHNNFMQSNNLNDYCNSTYNNYPTPNYSGKGYQKCNRCRGFFEVVKNGSSLCFYHPKKAVILKGGELRYLCCNMLKTDSGCTVSYKHVFHHLQSGINGPLIGYASTKPIQRTPSIFGLDCEMVFTSNGFEVARITLLSVQGETLLDTFVQPEGDIFDYNTQFSGIMPKHLKSALSFNEAQQKVLDVVSNLDILVGHSLEGDLAVLKVLHRRVVDTSLLFQVISGETDSRRGSPLPYRQALKSLVKEHLGENIQNGGSQGHDSLEDAAAALNLALIYVRDNNICNKKNNKNNKIAPTPSVLHAISA